MNVGALVGCMVEVVVNMRGEHTVGCVPSNMILFISWETVFIDALSSEFVIIAFKDVCLLCYKILLAVGIQSQLVNINILS